jgi:hypothetical protein
VESDKDLGYLLFNDLSLSLFIFKLSNFKFKFNYYLNDFFFIFFDTTIYYIISSRNPFLFFYLDSWLYYVILDGKFKDGTIIFLGF